MREIRALLLSLALSAAVVSALPAFAVDGNPPKGPYPPIVVYTTSWCPHSKAAKKFLSERGIPFTNRDIETDTAARAELRERYGTGSVPVIVIGDGERVLKGFSSEKLEEALGKRSGGG